MPARRDWLPQIPLSSGWSGQKSLCPYWLSEGRAKVFKQTPPTPTLTTSLARNKQGNNNHQPVTALYRGKEDNTSSPKLSSSLLNGNPFIVISSKARGQHVVKPFRLGTCKEHFCFSLRPENVCWRRGSSEWSPRRGDRGGERPSQWSQ